MSKKAKTGEKLSEKRFTAYDLEYTTYSLLFKEPFWSAMSRRINKTPSKSVPTAGVWVNPHTQQFELIYSPEFMATLTSDEAQAVICHEFSHLLFEHVTHRKAPKGRHELWNVACDLAVNSNISNLPKMCCIPGEKQFKDYPSGESAEYYYNRMLKDPNIKKSKIVSLVFDDHSNWTKGKDGKPSDGTSKEIASERLRNIVKKAVEESTAKGWGNCTNKIKERALEFLHSTIDWKKVLRYFIKTSQRAEKRSTVRRINRRYAYIHPGKKVTRLARVAVSIDQSGSVSDDLLCQFFGELNGLANIATFTVIPFDHEIAEDKIYEWKKGQVKKPERVLCGGTCFDAPTKYVNEHGFDGHIILTDMCAPKPVRSKPQRLWITDENMAKNPQFKLDANEKIIGIKEKKNEKK